MPELVEMEARLAKVEQAVADLARQLAERPKESACLERFAGISDPEGFLEAMAYARELRSVQFPEEAKQDAAA